MLTAEAMRLMFLCSLLDAAEGKQQQDQGQPHLDPIWEEGISRCGYIS